MCVLSSISEVFCKTDRISNYAMLLHCIKIFFFTIFQCSFFKDLTEFCTFSGNYEIFTTITHKKFIYLFECTTKTLHYNKLYHCKAFALEDSFNIKFGHHSKWLSYYSLYGILHFTRFFFISRDFDTRMSLTTLRGCLENPRRFCW